MRRTTEVILAVLFFVLAVFLVWQANDDGVSVSAGRTVSTDEVSGASSTLELRETVRLGSGKGEVFKFCDTQARRWVYVVNGNSVSASNAVCD